MSSERNEYAPRVSVDLFDINHSETIAGCFGNSYRLGNGPTPYGHQYTLEQVESDYAMTVHQDFGPVDKVHQGVMKIAKSCQSAFAREVGFGYLVGDKDEEFIDLTTMPTAPFVNKALGRIFETKGEKPPLEFIDVRPEDGSIDQLLLTRLLSEGVVPLPTPDDKKLFSHYFADGVLGIARINQEVANVMIEQARTIMFALESKEKYHPLSEVNYRAFGSSTDINELLFSFKAIAAKLTIIGQIKISDGEIVNSPKDIKKTSCTSYLTDMLEGAGYLRRALRAGRILGRLTKHVVWLENTATQLRTAN